MGTLYKVKVTCKGGETGEEMAIARNPRNAAEIAAKEAEKQGVDPEYLTVHELVVPEGEGPVHKAKASLGTWRVEDGKVAPAHAPASEKYDCDVCGKVCDHVQGEIEICTECGAMVCKEHCVMGDLNLPYCHECGRKEAERQMKADAPGVWPEWAACLK